MKNKLFKFRDNKKIHANFRDKQYFSHYCLSFKIIEKKIQNKSGGNIISGVIVYKLIVIKKTKEIDRHTLFRRFSHRPENSDQSRSKISEQCLIYHIIMC